MHVWSITFSHYRLPQTEIKVPKDGEDKFINELAATKGITNLEIDDFTDEVHAHFRDKKGKRRAFLFLQYEGRE